MSPLATQIEGYTSGAPSRFDAAKSGLPMSRIMRLRRSSTLTRSQPTQFWSFWKAFLSLFTGRHMTARMCDAPAKRLLEPQGISCLLCRQTSTDDRFMPRFYEPDLGADPDSPVLDRLSDLVRHRSGSSGRSACELAMALNCRAIRVGVIPALKAARTAFTWLRVDLPLTVRRAGRLSMFWGWLCMFWGWLSRNRGHVCGSHHAHGHKPSAPLSFRHCCPKQPVEFPVRQISNRLG
jgi:hypothetical protein